jgi:tripartite-type tricarboxylate transporter receptor subunit TctC
LHVAVGAIAATIFAGSSPAQTDGALGYPSRPVRMLVGATAGSQSDLVARVIAQKIGEHWGRPVIVENRSGAGGAVAAASVAKAVPDGYSLLLTNQSFTITVALQQPLPYDPIKDFAGVSQLGFSTGVLVTSPALRAKSVKDLIELAKARPGHLLYGSGTGQTSHLNGEKFRLATGIDVVNVPFKAGAEALIETVAGRTHYAFAGLGPALPFIKDGKLAALAVTTPQRSPILPDVPALAEVVRDFGHEGAYGLFAPARTPRAVLNRLSAEVARVLALPDVNERMLAMGFAPASSTPEECDRALREQIASLTKLVRDAGLRPQ